MTEGREERLAVLYACDRVYDLLVEREGALRVNDIASAIKGHIEVPPSLLREWLKGDGRFVVSGRRFDLAIRAEGRSLPVEAFIRRALREAGHPLSLEAVASLLATAKRRRPEQVLDFVAKIMSQREGFFPVDGGSFGLSEWLLQIPSDDEEEILLANFFERYAEVKRLVEGFDFSGLEGEPNPAEVAKGILSRLGEPAEGKLVALLARRVLGERFDPVGFYKSLLGAEGLIPLSDGTWCLSEWVEEARRWAQERGKKAIAEVIEVTPRRVLEVVAGGECEPLELSAEEREAVRRVLKEEGALSITEVVERALDIGPGDEDYLPALVAVHRFLKSDQRVEPVGALKFALKGAIPPEIREVPNFLLPHPPITPPDAEESPDVLLDDEGLEGNLAQFVHDPELEDIGEEEEAPDLPEQALPSEEVVYTVLFHHFSTGVVKVRRIDRKVIPSEPRFIEATLLTPKGERKAWINNELGLMFLGEDFFGSLGFPPSGGRLRIKPADAPDTFLAEMSGTDNRALISDERVRELTELREVAERESLPTFEIVRGIMEKHRKGAEFLTVYAEANVVRRVSKRMVASILSGYHCFYQRRSQPNLWTYDERRLAQGFKSAKKKHLRRG